MVNSRSEQRTWLDVPVEDSGRTLTSRRLWTIITAMLGCSLLLQLVAMCAPGWLIYGRLRRALFYEVQCYDYRPCQVKCIWEIYMEALEEASGQPKAKIATRKIFSLGIVREQTGALLAFAFTLASILILVFCRNARTKTLFHIWFILTGALLVTGVVMGEIIYVYLVELDALIKTDAFDNDTADVGFPYCVLFYAIACIQVFVAVAGMVKRFHDRLEYVARAKHEETLM